MYGDFCFCAYFLVKVFRAFWPLRGHSHYKHADITDLYYAYLTTITQVVHKRRVLLNLQMSYKLYWMELNGSFVFCSGESKESIKSNFVCSAYGSWGINPNINTLIYNNRGGLFFKPYMKSINIKKKTMLAWCCQCVCTVAYNSSFFIAPALPCQCQTAMLNTMTIFLWLLSLDTRKTDQIN